MYRDTSRTIPLGAANRLCLLGWLILCGLSRSLPAHAHRALDKLDYVLGWLPEIAQNSNVPREQWQTVGEDSQKLRDLFNQVHANIDEGRDPDYASVAEEIDAAVERLAAIQAGAAGGGQQ